MCTRFSFDVPREKLKRQFNLNVKEDLQKSYNIGPTHNAYVLTNESLALQIFRWGLIPHWAKDKQVGANLINAKAEGIAGKHSFRLPVRQRRCLVFADSYYVWQKKGLKQQPYRILLTQQRIMAFAGIWDVWVDTTNNKVYKTFSIITTPANPDLIELGIQRMPVILTEGNIQARWLSEASLQTVLRLLQPLATGQLEYYPVTKAVEDLSINTIDLHKAVNLEVDSE